MYALRLRTRRWDANGRGGGGRAAELEERRRGGSCRLEDVLSLRRDCVGVLAVLVREERVGGRMEEERVSGRREEGEVEIEREEEGKRKKVKRMGGKAVSEFGHLRGVE